MTRVLFGALAVADAVLLAYLFFLYGNDRLTMFDALAGTVDSTGVDLFGTKYYAGESIGRFLIILLGAGYLAEKYLLQTWRVRWPVPILPLVALGWVGWIVNDGERRLRDFVTQYEWRPITPQVPWLDALAECESLGDGWRLPVARSSRASWPRPRRTFKRGGGRMDQHDCRGR